MKINHSNSYRMRTLLPSLAAAALLVPFSAGAYDSDSKKSKSKESAETRSEQTMTEKAKDTASDIRMHLALETKFAASDELSALAINTDVKDGVVHLKGDVDTAARKEMATELARSVDGVKSVRNDLMVTGGEPGMLERMQDTASDAALTTRVKTRLLASRNTSGLAIKVSTDDDVVMLEGEVDTETERELAELIAANTSGVADVRNELRVNND
jgi:hyperosmotically inducible periplasmic protein